MTGGASTHQSKLDAERAHDPAEFVYIMIGNITASVVLYNTPEWQLSRLLQCLAQSSVHPHVYLVDNSPVPLVYECMRGPEITVIHAETNKGYGAGHNIALRRIIDCTDFHFVLNPDIYFEETELEKMLAFMEADAAVGLLMPKVSYPDGTIQYLCKLLPTPSDLLLRRFAVGPLKLVFAERARQFELRITNYDEVMDVPYLSGCFMLFRVSSLREIGLFDERFFMYPEDIDISRRIRARFRTVYYPKATVVHDHARESYKSTRMLRIHIWNMIKYFNKWGWVWDSERARFNRETLQRLQLPLSTCSKVKPLSASNERRAEQS
jgi:GT2 family glycosyltransferase